MRPRVLVAVGLVLAAGCGADDPDDGVTTRTETASITGTRVGDATVAGPSTTIWVDRSSDGGATFGTDVALTDDGIHRWPMLTVDTAGTIHLVRETQSGDAGGITYSRSIDGGITFDPPTVLLPDTDDSGPRRAPSVVAHGEHLLVTWTDRDGGHLAVFTIADLPADPPRRHRCTTTRRPRYQPTRGSGIESSSRPFR